MKHLPITLIYARLVAAFIILLLSITHATHFALISILLFSFGLLSDIFDGIIARRLGISTPRLRRLDSAADQVFWLCIATATFMHCPQFLYNNYVQLLLLIAAEALCYAVSYIRFRKEVATHAISSKLWVLTMFATLIQVMATCNSTVLFQVCFYAGIVTRLEIIAILLLLKNWTTDVPSVYHAIRLRNGKDIKRNKLFNG